MKQDNYTDKSIEAFTSENTLYLTKMSGGYEYTFLIRFISFKGLSVVGEILDIQPNDLTALWLNGNYYTIGDEISGAIKKCYTTKNMSANWFNKVEGKWVCGNRF